MHGVTLLFHCAHRNLKAYGNRSRCSSAGGLAKAHRPRATSNSPPSSTRIPLTSKWFHGVVESGKCCHFIPRHNRSYCMPTIPGRSRAMTLPCLRYPSRSKVSATKIELICRYPCILNCTSLRKCTPDVRLAYRARTQFARRRKMTFPLHLTSIRRRQYSRVLAEPPLISRGYSTTGSAMMGEDSAGSSGGSGPSSEGYTALLSNGGELLLLLEHCRVVVDNVVDAPQALLAAGNIENAALGWQKKISWFQARLC